MQTEVQNTFMTSNWYKYTKNIPLNKTEILKRLREEDIFSLFLSQPVDYKQKYFSPFRNDRNAGCCFWQKDNTLYFVDFANLDKTHFNCFELGMKIYNISFSDVLKLINFKFNLGLDGTSFNAKPVIQNLEKRISPPKTPVKFNGKKRDYLPQDIAFWSQYGITKEQLLEDKVFPVEFYTGNKSDGTEYTIYSKQTYAFTEFAPAVKFYSPNNPNYKWITNCNNSHIGNIKTLSKSEFDNQFLIITKSYKDCRVLRNLGFNSIWIQNEKVVLPQETIDLIKNKYKYIFTFFDNDDTGIALTEKYEKLYNIKGFRVPKQLKEKKITDPSDFVKQYGYDNLKKLTFWEYYYFKHKIILPKNSLEIVNGKVKIKEEIKRKLNIKDKVTINKKEETVVNKVEKENKEKSIPFTYKLSQEQIDAVQEEWDRKWNLNNKNSQI